MRARCGRIMIPPCEKTRSTGAEVAGMLKSLVNNGRSEMYSLLARKLGCSSEEKSSWLIAAKYLASFTSGGTSADSFADASALERW